MSNSTMKLNDELYLLFNKKSVDPRNDGFWLDLGAAGLEPVSPAFAVLLLRAADREGTLNRG